MLLLVALVLAAPRLDGVYVSEEGRQVLDGPATGPDELRLLQTVTFTRTKVTVHFVLEDEVLEWKPGASGLEVKPEHGGWRTRTWQENADGSVESSLLAGRLRFVPGSVKGRLAAAERRFTAAQLQRLAGRYGDALTVEAGGVRRAGALTSVTASSCNPACEATFPSVCLQADDLVLLETATGLLQLPRTALALCGGYVTGVDPSSGVALERAASARPSARLEAKVVIAALQGRARALSRCNPGTTPLPLSITLSVADSGLVSKLDAGKPTACLSELLSKLVFPGGATGLELAWTLPAP